MTNPLSPVRKECLSLNLNNPNIYDTIAKKVEPAFVALLQTELATYGNQEALCCQFVNKKFKSTQTASAKAFWNIHGSSQLTSSFFESAAKGFAKHTFKHLKKEQFSSIDALMVAVQEQVFQGCSCQNTGSLFDYTLQKLQTTKDNQATQIITQLHKAIQSKLKEDPVDVKVSKALKNTFSYPLYDRVARWRDPQLTPADVKQFPDTYPNGTSKYHSLSDATLITQMIYHRLIGIETVLGTPTLNRYYSTDSVFIKPDGSSEITHNLDASIEQDNVNVNGTISGTLDLNSNLYHLHFKEDAPVNFPATTPLNSNSNPPQASIQLNRFSHDLVLTSDLFPEKINLKRV